MTLKIPAIISKIVVSYFRWLAMAVVVLILALGYVFLIASKLSEINTTQIATQQSDVERLKQQQSYLEALKQSNSRYDQLFTSASLKSINDFLPSDPDFPGLLLTVKNMVSKSGLSLQSFTVVQGGGTAVASGSIAPSSTGATAGANSAQAATTSGLNIQTQDVSIVVTGGTTYETYKNFLKNIESSQRIFDIVTLSFTAPKAGTSSIAGKADSGSWSFVLRTYYLP